MSSKKNVLKVAYPTVEIEGHRNELCDAYNQGDVTLTAVGFARIPGTNKFASFKVVIEGGQVVAVECDEPNLRSIAFDSARSLFVTEFVDSEV